MNGKVKSKLIGLDTNIFIYHFEDNPEFIRYTEHVFLRLSEGKLQAVTSIISVIEALSYPAPSDVLKGIEESFHTMSSLAVIDVDHHIATQAARIRRSYAFRLPDAVQLATALHVKAEVFITNDQRLKQFKELQVILLSEVRKV